MKSKKLIFIISNLFLLSNLLFSQDVDFASLFNPSNASIEFSKVENPTDTELIKYALLFSEVENSKISIYLNKYENIISNFDTYIKNNSISKQNKKELAEAILTFLYIDTLKKYSLTQTKLTTLFDTATYNCVSSSILYYAIAMRYEIDISAIQTKDHAFCVVQFSDEKIDVETTNKYGFDPGNKKEFKTEFGRTGFVYSPPSNYKNRFPISSKELVAITIQNMMADAQKARNFKTSLQLSVDYYTIFNNEKSLAQLQNECSNYAAYLDTKTQYLSSVDFLHYSQEKYGASNNMKDTASKSFYNFFVVHFKNKNTNVITQLEEANAIYEKYKTSNIISEKMKTDVKVLLYNYEVQNYITEKNWNEVLNTVEKAKQEFQNNQGVIRLEKNAKQNIAVYFHNQYVTFFNKGNKDEAKRVVEEGLKIISDNTTLLNDLKRLQK